ncbi:MAG: LysM peptidoglycan-binding domain-containing protein [Firmicutes bacterium]|nr:LysM peptidoglycan-binding domain-containing protein [Bacillota bacterium]
MTYQISPYETLYDIARKFGITLQELMDYNHLSDYTPIYPGMILQIPPAAPQPPANTIYTVQRGDSLWSIAQKFGVSVENIMYMNNLVSPILCVGQQLVIPAAVTPF